MPKQTLDQELHSRKLHAPNSFVYSTLMQVIKVLNAKDHTEFHIKKDPSKEPGPIVMIANHSTRVEYQFTCPPCLPKKLNFVVGYNEFFRSPLNIVLKYGQVVPKKNFTPDIYCVKQIMSLVKQGCSICLMPEGMSSITGMAQPVMIGTGKLIKKLGIPVYYSKIAGGYLAYTKHCLDVRHGKVEVTVDQMFTPEDLKNMTDVEIEARMNELLAHDDYIWNKEHQYKYDGKGQMAKELDTLLYMCPKCGEMHKMECFGNTMRCTACGNTIEIDECYNIKAVGEDSVCPDLVTDWTIMEREQAAKDVRKEGFSYSEHVRIGMLPEYKLLAHEDTSIIVGDGMLTLDKEGLHFRGNKNGEAYEFDLTTEEVPTFGMCTDISRFYTFVKGEFIEFFPDSRDVLRWDHLTEEMHRANGGKWQNTEYRHHD
ncbi:MAG: hypothetical protein KBS56_05735 [Clostridiales bacterium]|nr:hypothetical protein [Candidatus Crickella equi]